MNGFIDRRTIAAVRFARWRSFARVAGVTVMAGALIGSAAAAGEAFTLIPKPPSVTSTPGAGLPTATFSVRGLYPLPTGTCPVTAPASVTFKFYWYKVETSRKLLWTKTSTACSAGVVDSGPSPALLPPAPLNYPATFVIQVAVFQSNGSPWPKPYTNTKLYRVLAPPSPSASPKTTPPCGAPGAAPCPSPTATSTPCAAAQTAGLRLPQANGSDAAVVLALAIFGALPIGGIAMVMSPSLSSRRRGWSRWLALIGLSALLLSVTDCAPVGNQVANASPEQSQQGPSPSPSPSPTC